MTGGHAFVLALQSERVVIHFNEIISDRTDIEHNPIHMLDRAIVLAGFSVRRMIEKRLVTDKLAAAKIPVRSYVANGTEAFRPPFHSQTGGDAFHNYNLAEESPVLLRYADLANEIIHSSQIMVVQDESMIPNGILVASDWNLKKRLLHLTVEEFTSFVHAVLDDRVKAASNSWDWKTGQVHSRRE